MTVTPDGWISPLLDPHGIYWWRKGLKALMKDHRRMTRPIWCNQCKRNVVYWDWPGHVETFHTHQAPT